MDSDCSLSSTQRIVLLGFIVSRNGLGSPAAGFVGFLVRRSGARKMLAGDWRSVK
jgi:hypothetical protein